MSSKVTNKQDATKSVPKGWKITFWISFSISAFLLIGGAITPPPFKIDSSMFEAAGILMGFPTLYAAFVCIISGINKGTGVKYTKGDSTLEITGDDSED